MRNTIAAYTHALDDGRTDDVVATFCPDGAIDMGRPGHATRATTRCAPPTPAGRRDGPQRHLVLNTHITEWDDHEAKAVSDVVFLLQGKDGWAVQLVGRYHDVLHHDDGTAGASTTAPRCSKRLGASRAP